MNRVVCQVREHRPGELVEEAVATERERCAEVARSVFDHFTAKRAEAAAANNETLYEAYSLGMAAASRIETEILQPKD